jgi:glycosyltransferase involved in cell wall biosynthesis
MRTNLKLSVVVPIYNQEAYLEKCISSILNQRYNFYEIILIDDGSTDASSEIAYEYSTKYSHIRYFRYKNSGLGEARNNGIKKSSGKYIIFVDCDDRLSEDLFEKLDLELDKGLDFVNYGLAFERDSRIIKKFSVDHYKTFIGPQIFELSLLDNIIITSSCNKAFSRKFLIKNNIFFPALRRYEDIFFTRMVSYYAKSTSYIPGTFYFADVREGSNMRSFDEAVIKQINDLFIYEDDFFFDKIKSPLIDAYYKLHKIKLCLFLVYSSAFRSSNFRSFIWFNNKMLTLISSFASLNFSSYKHLGIGQLFVYFLMHFPVLLFGFARVLKFFRRAPY